MMRLLLSSAVLNFDGYEVVGIVSTRREQLAPAQTDDGEQYVSSNNPRIEHRDEVITGLDMAIKRSSTVNSSSSRWYSAWVKPGSSPRQ
jgi:hypothetical protein